VSVEQWALTASVGHFVSSSLGWSVNAGGILGGNIEGRDVAGGATAAGVVSWLPVFERPARPFVGITGSLGVALAQATADDARTHSWLAFDLRGGATVGKTFGPVVPYAALRVFGGPVFWQRNGAGVVGGDRYHVTVGAGLTVRAGQVDLTVEAMPLGEQSVALGASVHL
jgi:hypothetical protein